MKTFQKHPITGLTQFKNLCGFLKKGILVFLFFVAAHAELNAQTSPVTVTTILGYPPAIYLPSLYTAGSNKLTANLILNDFNEPSRDVYLRITIESQNLKVSTKPDFFPTEPITLYPGVMVPLSGDDLEPYLNYNNVTLQGIEYNTLIANGGKLPEGFYTFCVEAWDFATHRLISNSACVVSNLAQFEPPQLTTPKKGEMIAPTTSQNINFTWVNPSPVDPTNVYYAFTLYELIDPSADPLMAIKNNQAVVVHQEEVATTMFNYNSSHPLLEVGKTYIYTVQNLTYDGKALFKNKGLSEVSYFYYGYPADGVIQLVEPANNSSLQLVKDRIFSWTAPSKLLAGQSYNFDIKIAMIDSTKTYEEVLEDTALVYHKTTVASSGTQNFTHIIKMTDAYFESGKSFVWQVKAYTEEQEIAKSDISTFGGPPCIEDFFAADERIKVSFTTGCDLTNLTGAGEFQLFEGTDPQSVTFNNVGLIKSGVQYYLNSGEVVGDLGQMDPLELNPEYERNGAAYFIADSFRITPSQIRIKGYVEWDLPHAADQEEKPVIRSQTRWLLFEDGSLMGELPFQDSTSFNLLDPMNIKVSFTEGSRFYIRGDLQYFIDFIGDITLPYNVNSQNGDTLVFPFGLHEQIYTVSSIADQDYTPIQVANRTTLTLQPTSFVLDLDDQASTGYFSSQPEWKGLVINKGIYSFNGDYAFSKQFVCDEAKKLAYDFNSVAKDHAYIEADGLYVYSNIDFGTENDLFFNTFPTLVDNFMIDVSASYTNDGQVTGGVSVPFLDDTDRLPFTCNLNQLGFQAGFLNESLDGRSFVFNSGAGEQELNLTINKGYFADNERIETNLTVYWPNMDLTFEALPQFNIWGNYDIGFGTPNNGYTLAEQKLTQIKGFEVTFEGIAAGRNANLYSFAFTGTMLMGEDVSGDEGPPKVNLYSIYESQSIDEKYIASGADQYINVDQTSVPTSGGAVAGIGESTGDAAIVGDIDAINAKYANATAEASAGLDKIKPKWGIGEKTNGFDLQKELAELVDTSGTSEEVEDHVEGLSVEEIKMVLVFARELMDKDEDKTRIDELIGFLDMLTDNELLKLLDKFKDLRGYLNELIENAISSFIKDNTKFIRNQANDINKLISTPITNGTNELLEEFNGLIDQTINYLAKMAINTFSTNPKIAEEISELSISVRENLKAELARTTNKAVKENIIDYLTGTVNYVMYDGTIGWLGDELSKNAADVLTDKNFKLSDVNIDLEGHIQEVGDELASRFTWDTLEYQVRKTLQDAYDGFSWDSIRAAFIDDFAASLISGAVEKFAGEALGDLAGATFSGLAANVDLDFSNLGEKLKSGDLSGIVKFDPSRIVIRSKPADIDGFVYFFEDDPIWGDCWQAEINAKIKIPDEQSAFIVLVNYINGSKPISDIEPEPGEIIETFKYWFFEVGVMDIKVPLGTLPIAMYGIKGKIYHHMCRLADNVTYQPNDSIRYGAGLRVYMMDKDGEGQVIDFNLGLELELVSGGFVLELNGDALISNTPNDPDPVTTDKPVGDGSHTYKKSMAAANGFLRYNSVDKHLLGELNAELLTSPVLCAGGGMIIDISKDWWQFAIGTREEPMAIALLCRDTIFKGWFDINKTGLDVGLFAHLGFDLRTPYVNLVVAKVQGWASFRFDFEAELIAYWKPKFGIQKARVFLDLYAGIGINYKTPPLYKKVNTFTIAAVNLGGELEFATMPEAYLKGGMHGSVTVLNCTVGLKFDAEINL